MGNTPSSSIGRNATKEQIGAAIMEISKDYDAIRQTIVSAGIDGAYLANKDKDELETLGGQLGASALQTDVMVYQYYRILPPVVAATVAAASGKSGGAVAAAKAGAAAGAGGKSTKPQKAAVKPAAAASTTVAKRIGRPPNSLKVSVASSMTTVRMTKRSCQRAAWWRRSPAWSRTLLAGDEAAGVAPCEALLPAVAM